MKYCLYKERKTFCVVYHILFILHQLIFGLFPVFFFFLAAPHGIQDLNSLTES